MITRILIVVTIGFVLGACAQKKSLYEWGNYQDGLYNYYKNPEKTEILATALNKSIVNGESSKRVPPGIFAEYGYILMIRNESGKAVEYFEKEKVAWPESTVLMDKMIALAKNAAKKMDKGNGKKEADAK